ncbi:MAG: M23 family metallopeptidase [Actinomycetota bacterium]|nr:M23 family metallopeptidase [Actinomycetota bacterium]
MKKRLPLALLLVVGAMLAAGSTGASQPTAGTGASASAFGIKVLVPGAAGGSAVSVSAPPDTVGFAGGFSYGSSATTGSISGSASASATSTATASASATISSVSLFGGEVTAGSVAAKAQASTVGTSAAGNFSGSYVSGLTVLGAAAATGAGARVALGDWGYAIVLEESAAHGATSSGQNYRGFVTALDIHLTAAHGGLPAGTEIQIGHAEASVQAAPPPPPPPTKTTARVKEKKTRITVHRPPRAPEPGARSGARLPRSPFPRIPHVHPKLTAGGYVFPVYGPSSFTDTFGASRADVNWHHGDDIFAPLGAPLLACAEGTVFSVGWNEVGGNRLWLRDAQGNEFYYAHLSAFSPLARNGAHVKAGEVVGFVGNTGDAAGTPYHVHFEIHPVSLLNLRYDGAVNPTSYLTAWKHLQDVRATSVAGWLPNVRPSVAAPKPGAILLQVSDISQASGLDPGSLRRAFVAPASAEGDLALLRARDFLPQG